MSTLAGQPGISTRMDDGISSAATFSFPRDIHVDPSSNGSAFVADYANCAIRKVDLSSSQVETYAGMGCQNASSSTSVVQGTVCPARGSIKVLLTLKTSMHDDAGSSNNARLKLGADVGSTTERWSDWKVSPGPLLPKGSELIWEFDVEFVPDTVAVDADAQLAGDSFGIGELIIELCNLQVVVVQDTLVNTLPSAPGGSTWVLAQKEYAFASPKREVLVLSGPAAVTSIQSRDGQAVVIVADRSYWNHDGTIRNISDWDNQPNGVNYSRGDSVLRVYTSSYHLALGGQAGYADGFPAPLFDASGLCSRPNSSEVYVADDNNYLIRKVILYPDSAADPVVSTFAGVFGRPSPHVGGDLAVSRFTRVRRLAFSPDGEHLMVSQAHSDGGGDPSKGVLRLVDMTSDTVVESFGPSGEKGHSDGYGSHAQMHNPVGVAFFPDGDRVIRQNLKEKYVSLSILCLHCVGNTMFFQPRQTKCWAH